MNKVVVAASAAALVLSTGASTAQVQPALALSVAAESSEMIWNAVATDRGRIFVAGPRWSGSRGPSLARIDAEGKPQPYPDAAWNAWQPGSDNGAAFVNVNAIHLDGIGGLWVVDTGSPKFGGDPLPGGAKLIRIDLTTDKVDRIVPLGPDVALAGSYVDDIRFNRAHAYLTDAGRPGLIVLDVASGAVRRVLDGHPSVVAQPSRDIFLDGQPVRGPDGDLLRVNSDPLEVSPDGRWLYYGPLPGPWSRIETRWLDDATLPSKDLATKVEPWADLPPVGGTAMDRNGDLYFTDLAANALRRRAPDGTITTLIQSPDLHWVDAPFIDAERRIWLPVPQIDRAPMFQGGVGKTLWPIRLYTLPLGSDR
ncbi:gluconolaconase [Azorhizobium oxalatiphilum]|uniref:Gluconolaconase n=1 Tax=Azorhizobium oxalatiphilum TaxID=980631 RepID=A0A917FJF2_9HYPH|nr:L-dopachrome tautomerase-related protein [Azorhizobium oxalatiphilum]GGF86014.1 gluconolaconase [Azorhizobium oxalatiphilum]